MSDPVKVPLHELVDAAQRELAMRHRVYVPVEVRQIDREFMGPGSGAGGIEEGIDAGRPAVEGPAP